MTTVDLREAEVPDKMDMWEATDPYFEWIEREGIKRIVDYKFEDLNDVELGNWERQGREGRRHQHPQQFPAQRRASRRDQTGRQVRA